MIISTGFAGRAGNTVINTILSDNLSSSGDIDLANAFSITAPAILADVAYIEFDFVAIKNTITLRYFLASKEYQYDKNYPCQFSNAVAFLLKNNTVSVYQNILLVPSTTTPVGIITVHPNLINVTGGGKCTGVSVNYFNDCNQNPTNIDGTNFNGSTKALLAYSTVIPGHSYNIKLVIADYCTTVANRLFESAVFIEAGSFDLSGYFTDQNTTTLDGSAVSCSSNPLVLHYVSQILNPTYQWFKDGIAIRASQRTASNYPIPIGGTGNYSLVVTDSQSSWVDNIPALYVQVIDASTALPQYLYSGANVANLVANGTNIKWYLSLVGGTTLNIATLLTTGIYYASRTIGSCKTTRTPVSITIGNISPTFNQVNPICSDALLIPLPISSLNGATGNWSPALNNTFTTTYIFTTNTGQCDSTYQLTVTINSLPTITASNVIEYAGSTITPLGSPFGGTFSTGSSIYLGGSNSYAYTYTGGNGCTAISTPASITINSLPTVTASNLSGCDRNAISIVGSLLSVIFSTGSSTYTGANTNYTYIYTDRNGYSAISLPATIAVNSTVAPTFNSIAALCFDASKAPVLPLISIEGIHGVWFPATIDFTASQTYVFTPSNNQCATSYPLFVTIQSNFDFTFKSKCVATSYILEVITNTDFNSTNAGYNWSINNNSFGFNSDSINVSNFVKSLQTFPELPLLFSVNFIDRLGCQRSKPITVTNLFCNIQKGITPNEDNLNDFFICRI